MPVQERTYAWAIVGAGPAGLVSAGLLIESGVSPNDIVIFDPTFEVGDFGQQWGEVSSNTTVKLFLDFLRSIPAFCYQDCEIDFPLDHLPESGFCHLSAVSAALRWVTQTIRAQVFSVQGSVSTITVSDGAWQLSVSDTNYRAEKVILAVGAEPKMLHHDGVESMPLSVALSPSQLAQRMTAAETVGVFGGSHSAMIVIQNLLDAGVKRIVNFYRTPLRFAKPMEGWTLYDNTGLKGETAAWVSANLSARQHKQVSRVLSTEKNITTHLPACDKVVYAIGFQRRTVDAGDIELSHYDHSNGIIAPGLFGAGIAYPRRVVDPLGNVELSVGLYKFMNDIRLMLPLWQAYGL